MFDYQPSVINDLMSRTDGMTIKIKDMAEQEPEDQEAKPVI